MLGRFEAKKFNGGKQGERGKKKKKTCRRQFLASSPVPGADRLADVDC